MQPLMMPDVTRPGARSTQALVLPFGGTRLLIAQQYGTRPDGALEKGLKAQLERAWINLFAVLEHSGFRKQHLIKITTYVTEPGRMGLVREIRDRMLEGQPCLTSCFQIAALPMPALLCELEAEAVMTQPAQ